MEAASGREEWSAASHTTELGPGEEYSLGLQRGGCWGHGKRSVEEKVGCNQAGGLESVERNKWTPCV